MDDIKTEKELIAVTLGLSGPNNALSSAERQLIRKGIAKAKPVLIDKFRSMIRNGGDPLGEAFARIRSPKLRRVDGATYTPHQIIKSMVSWAAEGGHPSRVVDPGAGSGRFLLAASRRFPKAQLVGVELDPLAALLLRANVAACGLAKRTKILVEDYRTINLPTIKGATLFIGNPPYVRHHGISRYWKDWYADAAAGFGIKASKLAGLHMHFFIKTMQLARPGDNGTFITSAEWLDVNYGSVLRELLAGELGGCALHVLNPTVMPFADAASTGAITCFRVGHRPKKLRVRAVKNLDDINGLSSGKLVNWDEIAALKRWTAIVRPVPKPPRGFTELGELCSVHRGAVTGKNKIWIAGKHAENLPSEVLVPTVTKARDILGAGDALCDSERLRKVIDLPVDLDEMDESYRSEIDSFLKWAKSNGAEESYIARHRRAWWSVGLRDPAPIMCTYMARRAPVFVLNLCNARHINIAHGLYPREEMSESILNALTAWLCANVGIENGRTYAGGLTKFEPGELERVPIPTLENLPI